METREKEVHNCGAQPQEPRRILLQSQSFMLLRINLQVISIAPSPYIQSSSAPLSHRSCCPVLHCEMETTRQNTQRSVHSTNSKLTIAQQLFNSGFHQTTKLQKVQWWPRPPRPTLDAEIDQMCMFAQTFLCVTYATFHGLSYLGT